MADYSPYREVRDRGRRQKEERKPLGVIFDTGKFLDIIRVVDDHLDENVSEEYKQQPLAQDWARISKVFEEGGESIDELIGYTGQNPRKGMYGSREDMLKELADTALTAIYAIQHFTKSEKETLLLIFKTAEYHARRMGLEVE